MRTFCITILTFLLSSPEGRAETCKIGGLIGLNISNVNYVGLGTDAEIGYGGRFMVHLLPKLEVGLSVTSGSITPSVNGVNLGIIGLSISETLITGEVDYHGPGHLAPFYVGARMGVAITSATMSSFIPAIATSAGLTGTGTGSSFAVGVVTGYEFPIQGTDLTIGPRLSYTFASSSSLELGALSLFEIFGSLSYGF